MGMYRTSQSRADLKGAFRAGDLSCVATCVCGCNVSLQFARRPAGTLSASSRRLFDTRTPDTQEKSVGRGETFNQRSSQGPLIVAVRTASFVSWAFFGVATDRVKAGGCYPVAGVSAP